MNATRLLLDFVFEIEFYWQGNTRQAEKAKSRIAEIQNFYGWSRSALINILVSVANERIFNRSNTLYLPSFGSSGSHLLQHVLKSSYGMIALGEVYLPPLMGTALRENLSNADRNVVIEVFHLLHGHPKSIFSDREIVNTAHYPDLGEFKDFTKRFKKALILRSPVDVMISRTFRKNEYREYLGKSDTSDFDYLKENVGKAKKFYTTALDSDFDEHFFYEDMLATNQSFAKAIVSFVGRGSENIILRELKSAIDESASNKYKGPPIQPPNDCVAYAESELSDICKKIEKVRARSR